MQKFLLMCMVALGSAMAGAWEPAVVTVEPLCKATVAWNQEGALNAHIHYDRNYPCGCDMLAWGQVLTYHALAHGVPDATWKPTPETGQVYLFQTQAFSETPTIETRITSGEPYDWAEVRDQGEDVSRLMYDLGVLGRTAYRPGLTSGTLTRKDIKRYFGYQGEGWLYTCPYYNANANEVVQREPKWQEMIVQQVRASLHAGAPLVVSLMTATGGHMVICDGYGYGEDGARWYHFHYGWGSGSGVWYPESWWWNVGGSDRLQTVNINVHPQELGCVIAGRVTAAGKPLADVAVTLQTGAMVKTDATGSYCFTGLAPSTSYTLTTAVADYEPATVTVKTGFWRDDALRGEAQTDWENTHGKENAYYVPLAGGNVTHDFSLKPKCLYVTPNGTGNGTTWKDATSLTAALAKAKPGQPICLASDSYPSVDKYVLSETLMVPAGVTLQGGCIFGTAIRNAYSEPTTITLQAKAGASLFSLGAGAVVDGFVFETNQTNNAVISGGTVKNCIFAKSCEVIAENAKVECCIARNDSATQVNCDLLHSSFAGDVPAGKGGGSAAGCRANATTDFPAAAQIGTCTCSKCPENGLNGRPLQKTPGALAMPAQGYSVKLL